MSLAATQSFGPYEVMAALGAGGMGEVWRARDTRLDREVALKLLPDAVAADPERLSRFEREARLLASLNHPNIAALHGLEQSGTVRALVMELVEGETLAERLERGPIPLTEALDLTRQIAAALECAHEHGIVHRDLKPANVKVTPGGQVKLLDFGLAKVLSGEGERKPDLESSPTRTHKGTLGGVILGTAPYMSPEQARGKAVDKRTDVWAFGVILCEMLTGVRLFAGETTSDVLAAVLRSDVDWSRLPAETPPPIRRLLRRCLERDPRQRLRDLGDARLEIEEAVSGRGAAPKDGAPRDGAKPGGWRRLSWTLGLAALVAAFVGGRSLPRNPRNPPRVSRLMMRLAPAPLTAGGFALSPDGGQFAYVARGLIHVRALDRDDVRVLAEARGDRPFFSRDGAYIAFVGGDGLLMKVPASGGSSVRITDRPLGIGQCDWGPDDAILCTRPESERPGELLRIPTRGGPVRPIPTAAGAAREHVRWPHVLPGGQAVLLTVTGPSGGDADDASVAVQRLDTGERRTLVRSGAQAVHAPTGHLVYLASGSLMAMAFDLGTLTPRGDAVPVVEHVTTDTVGSVRYALARDGTLVYRGAMAQTRPMLLVDRRGAAVRLPTPDHSFIDPRLSPDGSRIVVQAADAGRDIWVYDIARGALTRLTFDPQEDETPVFSPDGTSVAWAAQRSGRPRQVLRRRADGGGEEEVLWSTDAHVHVHDWSPDGTSLLVTQDAMATGRDVWLVPIGGGEARPLLRDPFEEWNPRFGPDGRWLAYASNESGQFEVYVRRFPTLDRKAQVSVGGGDAPAWAAGGREIVYRRPGDQVRSVRFGADPGGAPRVGLPEPLFPDSFGAAVGRMSHPDYDVFPDASRFVMLGGQQDETAGGLRVVLNWFEELKRVPPAR